MSSVRFCKSFFMSMSNPSLIILFRDCFCRRCWSVAITAVAGATALGIECGFERIGRRCLGRLRHSVARRRAHRGGAFEEIKPAEHQTQYHEYDYATGLQVYWPWLRIEIVLAVVFDNFLELAIEFAGFLHVVNAARLVRLFEFGRRHYRRLHEIGRAH